LDTEHDAQQKYLQIAGLDGRAISSKSLISYNSG